MTKRVDSTVFPSTQRRTSQRRSEQSPKSGEYTVMILKQ